MTILHDGRVLVAGGRSELGIYFGSEVFDPDMDLWTLTGFMSDSFSLHQAALLADGKVLITGGEFHENANLFNPTFLTWSVLEPMQMTRTWATATTLSNGRVLVASGFPGDGGYATPSAELFDEVAGAWHSTQSLSISRAGHTATLLNDGRVLVAGGYTATAEIYTPDFPCILGCVADIPTEGEEGVAMVFSGEARPSGCPGPESYHWDFGDGQTSVERSPSHTYPILGDYHWKFQANVANQACYKEGWIAVKGCTIECYTDIQPVSGPLPAVFSFKAEAYGSSFCHEPLSFLWDFGDGATSTEQETTHGYAAFGDYPLSLRVTSGDQVCSEQYVFKVQPPPGPEVFQAYKGTDPFRILVVGTNFQKGVKVKINGVEWPKVKWKSDKKILINGGKSLKNKFPKCTPTVFEFINPDYGNSAWQLYYCNRDDSGRRSSLESCTVTPPQQRIPGDLGP
jgi:hypothetical protein